METKALNPVDVDAVNAIEVGPIDEGEAANVVKRSRPLIRHQIKLGREPMAKFEFKMCRVKFTSLFAEV
jgi:hypothetical protein